MSIKALSSIVLTVKSIVSSSSFLSFVSFATSFAYTDCGKNKSGKLTVDKSETAGRKSYLNLAVGPVNGGLVFNNNNS